MIENDSPKLILIAVLSILICLNLQIGMPWITIAPPYRWYVMTGIGYIACMVGWYFLFSYEGKIGLYPCIVLFMSMVSGILGAGLAFIMAVVTRKHGKLDSLS